jgi:hypothetical protein
MPHSLSKVYVHITFSTKNRYPFIDDGWDKKRFVEIRGSWGFAPKSLDAFHFVGRCLTLLLGGLSAFYKIL